MTHILSPSLSRPLDRVELSAVVAVFCSGTRAEKRGCNKKGWVVWGGGALSLGSGRLGYFRRTLKKCGNRPNTLLMMFKS